MPVLVGEDHFPEGAERRINSPTLTKKCTISSHHHHHGYMTMVDPQLCGFHTSNIIDAGCLANNSFNFC